MTLPATDPRPAFAHASEAELARILDEAERLTARYATQPSEQVDSLAEWVASALRNSTPQGSAP